MQYRLNEAQFKKDYAAAMGRPATEGVMAIYRTIAAWAIESYKAGLEGRPLTGELSFIDEIPD